MSLSSLPFLLFLTGVVAIHFALPGRWRWAWLLLASYLFCLSWSFFSAGVLFAATNMAYLTGRLIASAADRQRKRAYLWAGLTLSILTLLGFKYLNFLLGSLSSVGGLIGLRGSLPAVNLLLPIGISFWTFQIISYLVDVYTGAAPVETHFGRFALYLAYFPRLLAGPIERHSHLTPQFREPAPFDYARLVEGLIRIGWGFFKKIVIADRLAVVVNTVYADPRAFTGGELLIATLVYAFQIYIDFSAYCDIAIGAARIMGIDLVENFHRPYFAGSVTDFWRRWHISLSAWLRDYIFMPLNFATRRKSSRLYTAGHILITFLISGLWHGANWTFVIWGGLHGLYQAGEWLSLPLRNSALKLFGVRRGEPGQRIAAALFTFALVTFAWIFFRAASVDDALVIIGTIFAPARFGPVGLTGLGLDAPDLALAGVLVTLFLLSELLAARRDLLHDLPQLRLPLRWAIYIIMLFAIILLGYYGDAVSQPFIYALF